MIKKLYTALYTDNSLLFFDECSGMSHFVVMKWILLVLNLDYIDLDHNIDENEPDTIILIRLLA